MALDLSQFEEVLKSAKNNDIVKKDLRKALRVVSAAIRALNQAVEEMNNILADDYQPVVKERKPRTVTPGGAKRGRKPKNATPAAS
jgi:histone H3/H4